MVPQLDAVEARVLGCLIEKEITTPEYYPLTMNALVNACNQKSNRDPMVSYDDEAVDEALGTLREKRLTTVVTGAGNRVPKFAHRVPETLNLGRREVALLCELMVRGPQTAGELKGSAARMHRFSDIDEVESCLRGMAERGFAMKMSKWPGTKEPRHAHLLCGEPAQPDAASPPLPSRPVLEEELESLKARVSELERLWREFSGN